MKVNWVRKYISCLITYQYVYNDVSEGLNYGVSAELYNSCMEGIGSSKRTEVSVSGHEFCQDFYREYNGGAK